MEKPETVSNTELKPVNNCWTIYWDEPDDTSDADITHLAEIGRPQDWGDPKWMYRVYVLEAQGYRNEVHCWVDRQMKEYEHLQLFASLICQILLPGYTRELSGREFMGEDDFWDSSWGEMPPLYDDDDFYGYDEDVSGDFDTDPLEDIPY